MFVKLAKSHSDNRTMSPMLLQFIIHFLASSKAKQLVPKVEMPNWPTEEPVLAQIKAIMMINTHF